MTSVSEPFEHAEAPKQAHRETHSPDESHQQNKDSQLTVKEALNLPYESKDFSDSELTQEHLSPLIDSWNAQDWTQVIKELEDLERKSIPLAPFLRHLRGIAYSLTGNYPDAQKLFEENLNERFSEHVSGKLDSFVIATSNWLASTSLILRKWDDAVLAWAIAAHNVALHDGDEQADGDEGEDEAKEEDEAQALTALSIFSKGSYTTIKEHPRLLAGSLRDNVRCKVSILPELGGKKKAEFVTAILPLLQSDAAAAAPAGGTARRRRDAEEGEEQEEEEEEAEAKGKKPQVLLLSHSVFTNPYESLSAKTGTPFLHHDVYLNLEPKIAMYTGSFGEALAEAFLLTRFLNKHHFPLINLTALYTTTNGLGWLTDTLRAGLQAKGFVTRGCWDRMRCARIRQFPSDMSYVTSFAIVFHRWPLNTRKHGFQIPLHLVRNSWSSSGVNTGKPAAQVYRRLCADVKALLPPPAGTGNNNEDSSSIASTGGPRGLPTTITPAAVAGQHDGSSSTHGGASQAQARARAAAWASTTEYYYQYSPTSTSSTSTVDADAGAGARQARAGAAASVGLTDVDDVDGSLVDDDGQQSVASSRRGLLRRIRA